MNGRKQPPGRQLSERRRPGELRRAELADAALRVITSRGIAALNTRTLAAEVGLTTGGIFKHFPSIAAVLDAAVGQVEAVLDATYPPATLPPKERLERFVEARSTTVGSQQSILRLLHSEQLVLALPEEGAARLRRCMEKTRHFILVCVREGQESGTIRADIEAEVLTAIIMGSVQMLAQTNAKAPPHGKSAPKSKHIRDGLAKLLEPWGTTG